MKEEEGKGCGGKESGNVGNGKSRKGRKEENDLLLDRQVLVLRVVVERRVREQLLCSQHIG